MRRILFLVVALLCAATGRAQAQGFTVVVNAASPVSSVSKAELSNVFLKKSVKWASGAPAVPVDLEKSSKTRDAFTKAVHGRPLAMINAYWQDKIFTGKDAPPAERSSDADVLAFVRGNPNAVGYVAAGTELGAGVKAVTVQ